MATTTITDDTVATMAAASAAARAGAFMAANEVLARLTEEKATLTPEGIAAIRDIERRRAVRGRARAIDREIAQARIVLSERHLAVIDAQLATAEGQRQDAGAALTQAEEEAADLLAGVEPARQAMSDAARGVNVAIVGPGSIAAESADLTAAKHAHALAQAQHEGVRQAESAARAALAQAENTLAALREGWLDIALRLEDQRHELLLLGPPAVAETGDGGR